MDREGLIDLLDEFIEMTTLIPHEMGRSLAAEPDEIEATAHLLERVLDAVLGTDWTIRHARTDDNRYIWETHRRAAIRARAQLQREEDVNAMIGNTAPTLSASGLHPWAWEAAKSLWNSRHYAQAVAAAAISVNAALQAKVSRRDVSESDLINQCFSDKPPEPGKPRLRALDHDGSRTADSRHRGVADLGRGLFAALRNPLAHDPAAELDEQAALEQLACWSVLARFLDQAEVIRAD